MGKVAEKQWIKSIFVLILGIIIAHLGVSFFLLANIGSDPFTVFADGLSKILNITVGKAHIVFLVCSLLIMFFTAREYLKIGTAICAIGGGVVIDFGIWAFSGFINESSNFYLRILIMIFGCIALAFGVALIILSKAGTGPNDLISVILADKIKNAKLKYTRMAVDAIFVVSGFLMGGVIGVGTIFAVFTVGPMIQFWVGKLEGI